MLIPVVLKGGHEELVSKDKLQFLMFNKQIMFFKRSEGWVVLGRDKMRDLKVELCSKVVFEGDLRK